MATFVADVPINLVWRGYEIAHVEPVASGRRVTPIPAGEPFDMIPDDLASVFLATFGPTPGNGNVSAGAAEAGRIPGLQRIR